MKHLPGADPELVLLSFEYKELEVRENAGASKILWSALLVWVFFNLKK